MFASLAQRLLVDRTPLFILFEGDSRISDDGKDKTRFFIVNGVNCCHRLAQDMYNLCLRNRRRAYMCIPVIVPLRVLEGIGGSS